MLTYFNEHAEYPAKWLRNLFPEADVDDRSICEVGVGDVTCYDRVHLFAGIGGWEYALRLAGWPDDCLVWTGSCPCQPFSRAGTHRQNGESNADPRHLWPDLFRLIEGNRPPVVFGEQVAGKLGLAWFDGVRANLERIGYACGMAVLPACGVGAPHRRERIFWVAERGDSGRLSDTSNTDIGGGSVRGVADTYRVECDDTVRRATEETAGRGNDQEHTQRRRATEPQRAGSVTPWTSYQLVFCTDGRLRRVEPGVFPLAPRLPGDVERIRAYGNSVIPQLAAVFIKSYMEVRGIIPTPPVLASLGCIVC